MQFSDHNGENFLEYAAEFAKLDEDAKAAILARHAALVSGNPVPVPAVPQAAQNEPR